MHGLQRLFISDTFLTNPVFHFSIKKCISQNNDEDDLETLMTSVGFQYYHLLARKFDLEPHLQKSGNL